MPGDLSPFSELKRIGANVYLEYFADNFEIKRFYPVKPLELCKTQEEYELGIKKAYEILHKNIELASENGKAVPFLFPAVRTAKQPLLVRTDFMTDFNFLVSSPKIPRLRIPKLLMPFVKS